MVSIRKTHLIDINNFDLPKWCESVGFCKKIIAELIKLEQLYKNKINDQRESIHLFLYGLEMANILSDMQMNDETIIAASIFPLVQTKYLSAEELTEFFGNNIKKLVLGVLEMENISHLHSAKTNDIKIDNIRHMLLAMVDDFRCVIIKLCERITFLRLAKDLSEEERVISAKECSAIYAPLANRLGIGQLKWELEDFSFAYLHPKEYKKIASLLDEKRVDRENYINNFVANIKQELARENITDVEVYGRPKHIYSIWRKLQKKHIEFSELYDVRAVRIITSKLQDCYAALGIIHTKYKYLPSEFDDYITNPKPNGYQSIHTVVLGEQGKVIEVQIRTKQMHEDAELGVAAHWKYKEGATSGHSNKYEEKIAWLRKLLSWQDEMADSKVIVEEMRSQVFDDRVYVFTPNGEVVDLPVGATPLDFAYHIHSEVGNKCVGAKVNGKIVSFSYELQMGDQVEIITKNNSTPSKDWLNPNIGFIKTSRAKQKVANWFKKQDKETNIPIGKEIFEEELNRLDLNIKQVEKFILNKYNLKNIDDLYAAIANNDIKITHVINSIQSQIIKPDLKKIDEEVLKHFNKANLQNKDNANNKDIILIEGVGNLMHHVAKCCQPIPGDYIVGYITQGYGISVHKTDCIQFNNLADLNPNRVIEAKWHPSVQQGFNVTLKVITNNKSGVLRDITSVLANEKVKVIKITTQVEDKRQLMNYRIEVELNNVEILSVILARISQLTDVLEAKRFTN